MGNVREGVKDKSTPITQLLTLFQVQRMWAVRISPADTPDQRRDNGGKMSLWLLPVSLENLQFINMQDRITCLARAPVT